MNTATQLNTAANIIKNLAKDYTDEILVTTHEDGVYFDGDVYDLFKGNYKFNEDFTNALNAKGLSWDFYTYSIIHIFKKQKKLTSI